MRLSTAIITVILLVAAGLRIHDLGAQSLWNDEGSSYVQATRTFREIAVNAAADIHPPGYYWALKLWHAQTGDSELALRYLSALAGVLTVAFAYGIGVRLYAPDRAYGSVTGLVAAALVALNTFAVFYSQEARMYALLALWATASTWALVGFFKRPNAPNGVLLGVFNALGLWTQYAFPLVMLAQGTAALLWLIAQARRGQFRRALTAYVLANALALALFAPLLPTAWHQVTTWPNTGDATAFPDAAGTVIGWLAFGVTYTEVDASWTAIMLVLVVFGLRGTGERREAWRSLLSPLLFFVPVAVFLYAGLFREGNLKFLLPSQVGLALAVGQGVTVFARLLDNISASRHDATTIRKTTANRNAPRARLRSRALARLAAGLAVTGVLWQMARGLPPLYTDPGYARDDYRAIAAAIAAALDDTDAIILNAPGQREVFDYYYAGSMTPQAIPAGLNDTDEQIEASVRRVLQRADDIFLVLWGDAERDPNRVVERTLDAEAFEVSNAWYGDVRLARYATAADWFDVVGTTPYRFGDHITLERYALNDDHLAPGDVLQVRLFWRTNTELDARYKVTLQLLDADGALVVQRDAEPGGGMQPTITWQRGITVTDNHALLIPTDISEANFTLMIALYNVSDDNTRLPVRGLQADNLTLKTITVTQPEAN